MPENSKPLISVITPCFNSEKTLRETIESVAQQDFKDYEHIVIDGGSRDKTLEIIKSYPHLQWISERDEGHYDAMNKGIARSKGEFIVILNADDCFCPTAFGHVAKGFKENPKWDALFADVIFVDGQGEELYRRKEALFDYDVMRWAFDYICHHTLFVRKKVYDAVGGYQHKKYKNACDYDFIMRMAKAGYFIGKIPEFTVRYRMHEFGQSLDKRIYENTWREMRLIKDEHGVPRGPAEKVLYVIGHAKRQLQKLIYRGTMDIIPAPFILRKLMKSKTTFSSNSGLDKL